MRTMLAWSFCLLFSAFLLVATASAQTAKKPAATAAQKPAAVAVQPKQVTPNDVVAAWKVHRRLLLLDVRTPAEFGAGHPQDAISAPLASFERLVKQYQIPKATELVIVSGQPDAPREAAAALAKMGYQKIGYLSFEDWQKAGQKVEKSAPPARKSSAGKAAKRG